MVDGSTLIAYTVGISEDKSFLQESRKKVLDAIATGYENAICKHKAWWSNYWSKSDIVLPDKFIERQYNFNAYLLGSCSRKGKFPMPLQGVWTADNNGLPPWKGDYHHDLNTQMSYTSYLKANRLDAGESFIDYLLDMSEAGRKFSSEFYGVEGLCLPSVMDIQGNSLGGWCQYSLSPTNQLWLCDIMARHYFFTGDKQYLENRMYPYMSEVGGFMMNMLIEKDGNYMLELSTSPEIHDNTLKAWLTPNTNYDLALMRAFCVDMIKTSNALGKADIAKVWESRLSKFHNLAVNADNVLMLCPDESLRESHRHHAHCMPIYPLRTMKYDTNENKKIIDSTIADLEKLTIKNWVGYSLGWMAQFYAVQCDGDKALKMLDDFFRYFCTDNGFHSNGDYRHKTKSLLKCRLFTLEANFVAMDAVQEMLVFSEDNVIKLLPAIPKTWLDLSFKNLRCYGGVLVSLKVASGVITQLKLVAACDIEIKLLSDNIKFAFDVQGDIALRKGDILSYGTSEVNGK